QHRERKDSARRRGSDSQRRVGTKNSDHHDRSRCTSQRKWDSLAAKTQGERAQFAGIPFRRLEANAQRSTPNAQRRTFNQKMRPHRAILHWMLDVEGWALSVTLT